MNPSRHRVRPSRNLASAPVKSKYRHARLLILCLALLGLGVQPAEAQEATEQQSDYPPPIAATERYQALSEEAVLAEQEIATLSDIGDLEEELADVEHDIAELASLLATLAEAEYMRPERITRIRDMVLQQQQRIESVHERALERTQHLQRIQSEWTGRDSYWRTWRTTYEGDPRLEVVAPQFQRALERIEAVITQADEAVPPVLALQNEAAELRSTATEAVEHVTALREGRRQALLDRVEPVLFTPQYFEGLAPSRLAEWEPTHALREGAHVSFLLANAGLLFLHIALVIIFGIIGRRLRRRTMYDGAWSGLLFRPKALAIFAATALLAPQYALAPPLWDVVIWALLASSGAVLATRLVNQPALRIMVYAFAGSYPVFLLAEAMLTPAAIFRPLLAAALVMGLVVFGTLLRREFKASPGDAWTKWALELGTGILFIVLVAEIFGFYLLARWIVHAAVATAYIVFVVAFLVVLARGAIETVIRIEVRGRLSFLQTLGVPLVRQVLRAFQLVLIIVALLQILDIWEIAPPPGQTWGMITGLGVSFAGIEITIGRVIAAAILIYLAISFSWLMRTFIRSEVYPRWDLERGVGESINTLLHYFLLTLGFFIALGALGFEMRNFAIIAGALGVGIGFGLQNIVNNFISGLILLFERPVRVGDTIVLDDSLGTIEKIGLRSTTVLTFDRAEVIVPNADLISEKVTNWTLTDPVARMIVPVGVAYGTNIGRVIEIMQETAVAHPDVLKDPPSQALFTEFGDSSLNFELRVWVQELRFRLVVRSALLAEIDRRFREEGIEIPFPQRDLHVRSVDTRIFDAARGGPELTEGTDDGPN